MGVFFSLLIILLYTADISNVKTCTYGSVTQVSWNIDAEINGVYGTTTQMLTQRACAPGAPTLPSSHIDAESGDGQSCAHSTGLPALNDIDTDLSLA